MLSLKTLAMKLGATTACTLLLITTAFARADERTPRAFDIGPQSLATALSEYARQSQQEILFAPAIVADKTTEGLRGVYPPLDALKQILGDTGLTFSTTPSGAILVQPTAGGPDSSRTPSAPQAFNNLKTSDPGAAKKAGFWDRFRLAQNDPSSKKSDSESEDSSRQDLRSPQETGRAIPEVIVTAQKRSERLQDVPVPVTAIDAGSLVDNNQLRIQDYYTRIPGLSMTTEDFGAPVIAIRGVTTGPSNPTVGIVVDDVPYGSSTNLGGGSVAPDIDPSDLRSIEVLRGPQGTLYGASSLGGLVKYVTVDPSTDRFSGRIQGGLHGIDNGDGLGHTLRGAVNVPLSETFAVRASAFNRRDPGYIDNVVSGEEGVNQTDAHGGRVSALWRPSDVFSLKLGALLQDISTDGSSNVYLEPGLGDLEQNSLRGTGPYEKKFQVYNATLTGNLGSAELISVSGYSINKVTNLFDFTGTFGGLSQANFGVGGAPLLNNNETKKFTQEVRLSTPIGERFEWLLGAYYNDEDSQYIQRVLAADPDTGTVMGENLSLSFPTTFVEYAAFTTLTCKVTDRFDVQLGGRESQNEQTFMQTFVIFGVPNPIVNAQVRSKENAFTYLVTPRFRVSPDLMVYARVASGYRPGGPNINAVQLGLPLEYKADTTDNYEVGIKGDVFDRKLSFDASVFYIDWKDMQLSLVDPDTSTGFFSNASHARSRGVELSLESRPLAGLVIAAWASWNDAELTEAFPSTSPAVGSPGDRLPFSSRFSGNLSVDQEFSLATGMTVFVGGSLSYVGDRVSVFTTTADRQTYPSYARTDVRTGLQGDTWAANVFVNNVTDRRGFIAGGVGGLIPTAFTYIQPRTVGVSFSKTF